MIFICNFIGTASMVFAALIMSEIGVCCRAEKTALLHRVVYI